MRELIRVGQHSSEIFLTRCDNEKKYFYQKSSYPKYGIRDLKNEYRGYAWYLVRAGYSEIVEVSCDIDEYFKLTIPEFDARPCDVKITVSNCFDYAHKAIRHYYDVWSNGVDNGYLPIHGDFSLEGNILFNLDNVYIIDWEHFLSNAAPIGFDVLFMLFELLKLDCKQSDPSKDQLKRTRELIEYAESINAMSNVYKDNYFVRYLEEQERLRDVWGNQYGKLPTNQFTTNQIKILRIFFT